MYPYANQSKFYGDKTDVNIVIEFTQGEEPNQQTITLTNDNIEDGTFELFESVTDTTSLTFSNCMCSYVTFSTNYTESLYQKQLNVKAIVDGDTNNPIPIGVFYVVEDNISFDKETQSITAYDALYFVMNADPEVIKYIYDSMPFPVTIKDFRDIFFGVFSIEQGNEFLINDDIYLPKQLGDEDYVSGDEIVKAIAEINGVFPHMGKDGLLHWITLDTGNIYDVPMYPSSTTFPSSETYIGPGYSGEYTEITKDQYEEGEFVWSNFMTIPPDGVEIRNETNTAVYITSDETINPYTVTGNFLCYGLSQGQYQIIADRLLDQIKYIAYVPFEMSKMRDPCIEPGDRVLIHGEADVKIMSYIFNKTTNEIQVAFEKIRTNGTYLLEQYEVGDQNAAKIKNLDNRVGNMEKSGSGPLQIVSVAELPANPQLNVLYLIQGEVVVE